MITLVVWAAFFILGLMFAIWDSWGCEVTIHPNCVNLFVVNSHPFVDKANRQRGRIDTARRRKNSLNRSGR